MTEFYIYDWNCFHHYCIMNIKKFLSTHQNGGNFKDFFILMNVHTTIFSITGLPPVCCIYEIRKIYNDSTLTNPNKSYSHWNPNRRNILSILAHWSLVIYFPTEWNNTQVMLWEKYQYFGYVMNNLLLVMFYIYSLSFLKLILQTYTIFI